MREGERTPQQLDPVGSLIGVPIVLLVGTCAVAYAIYSTIAHADQLTSPPLAFAAIVLLILATVMFATLSSPSVAPITIGSHALIVGMTLIAGLFFIASVWGRNRLIQDDWSQIAVGLIIMAMALFRPPVEIIVSGAICAAILGGVACAESSMLAIRNVPAAYFTVAATPVLTLAVAAAAYSHVITRTLLDWRKRATEAIAELEPEVRAGASRVVHQEQVTLLNEEAVPFLGEILERDFLTFDDIERAGVIAERLRRAALSEFDRGWLGEAIKRATGSEAVQVVDPAGLAEQMPAELRGTLSALIHALTRDAGLEAPTLSVVLEEGFAISQVTLQGTVHITDVPGRRVLAPYLSVLRVIATDARLSVRAGTVRIRFGFEPAGDSGDQDVSVARRSRRRDE